MSLRIHLERHQIQSHSGPITKCQGVPGLALFNRGQKGVLYPQRIHHRKHLQRAHSHTSYNHTLNTIPYSLSPLAFRGIKENAEEKGKGQGRRQDQGQGEQRGDPKYKRAFLSIHQHAYATRYLCHSRFPPRAQRRVGFTHACMPLCMQFL